LRHFGFKQVPTTGIQLLGPNPRRTYLVISAPPANRITLGFAGPVVLDQGINLYAADPPFVLLYDHIGQAIREEIWAIASTASQSIGYLDIFEEDCPCMEKEGLSALELGKPAGRIGSILGRYP